MTRFDAPAPAPSAAGSTWRAACAIITARFGIVLAALVPTVCALLVATALLCFGSAVPALLRQAFVSSPVLVFVAPTASRADVEALGPKLTALPGVATAALRTKEEALATLVADGLPAPSDGRNPLPDVWTVALRGDGPLFVTEAIAARDAIRALPTVDQVRFDDAWAESLDRAMVAWSRYGVGWLAALIGGVASALLGTYVLFGRALTAGSHEPPPTVVLMIVGCAIVIVAAGLAYALGIVLLERLMGGAFSALTPVISAVGPNVGRFVAETAIACLVLLIVGLMVARLGNSDRQSV